MVDVVKCISVYQGGAITATYNTALRRYNGSTSPMKGTLFREVFCSGVCSSVDLYFCNSVCQVYDCVLDQLSRPVPSQMFAKNELFFR